MTFSRAVQLENAVLLITVRPEPIVAVFKFAQFVKELVPMFLTLSGSTIPVRPEALKQELSSFSRDEGSSMLLSCTQFSNA